MGSNWNTISLVTSTPPTLSFFCKYFVNILLLLLSSSSSSSSSCTAINIRWIELYYYYYFNLLLLLSALYREAQCPACFLYLVEVALPGTLLRYYFLNNSDMGPKTIIITSNNFIFTFHMSCISTVKPPILKSCRLLLYHISTSIS